MSPEIIGVIGFCGLVGLVLLRVPVAIALGLVGLIGYAAIEGWERALNTAGSTPYDMALAKYDLTVVPLFILMGVVAARGGMSRELFQAANGFFSGLRGALAMSTIGACAGFGAICGSSLATSATMTRVAVPEMRRYGYDERLATGAVASGGTLGILIPPSVILVIYAIVAEQGVPQLFAAGLIPGLLLAALHVVVIWVIAHLQPHRLPQTPMMPVLERLRALFGMWKMIVLFGIAVGGIYLGWFSPTEAAAVSALAACLIAFGTRQMGIREFGDALLETIWTTTVLFFIAICAFLFSYFIVETQLPAQIRDWVADMNLPRWAVILCLVVFYMVLGCFLDSISMILITVPVFQLLIEDLGYSLIWFGVLVVVVVEIGLITPPVGMNIFVIRAQMPEINLGTIYAGVTPFLLADLALVGLLLISPELATWLPDVLYPGDSGG